MDELGKACEDCGEVVRRRTRCISCGKLVCRCCFHHYHGGNGRCEPVDYGGGYKEEEKLREWH